MSFPTRGTSLCEFSGLSVKLKLQKGIILLTRLFGISVVKLKEYKKVGLGLA